MGLFPIDYMEFIVPGLIMLSVITNSYGNITSSFFGAKSLTRHRPLVRGRC